MSTGMQVEVDALKVSCPVCGALPEQDCPGAMHWARVALVMYGDTPRRG